MRILFRNFILYLRVFLLIFSAAKSGKAQMLWDKSEIRVEASIDQKLVHVHFSAFNLTDHTYLLEEIAVSCGCTTLNLNKGLVFLPQTGAKFAVDIDIAERSRSQVKTVFLSFRDELGNRRTKVLTCNINIADILFGFPDSVRLNKRNAYAEKIAIVPMPSCNILDVSCESFNEKIVCNILHQTAGDTCDYLLVSAKDENVTDARIKLTVSLKNGVRKSLFLKVDTE